MTLTKTVATRSYAALLSLCTLAALYGGALLIQWSNRGVPAWITELLQIKTVTPDMLMGLRFFAGVAFLIAIFNAVFAFFAFRRHRWPVLLSTLGWTLVLFPLLRDTHNPILALVMASLVAMTAMAYFPLRTN